MLAWCQTCTKQPCHASASLFPEQHEQYRFCYGTSLILPLGPNHPAQQRHRSRARLPPVCGQHTLEETNTMMKILQQKELAGGWTPTAILNNSVQYRAKSPKGNCSVSCHLSRPLETWQGDTWHTSLLVLADFSPKVFNILRVGSITFDIMEEQDDNHLSAVQKHSNMVILTDP